MPYIRFGEEVVGADWDEDHRCWDLETSSGRLTADVVVGGMGGLSEPSIPKIDGLADFRGKVFHSAEWDHDHDLRGQRIGVIGTGASAVQFVPEIQPLAGRVHVFQRTPSWVLPDPDRRVTGVERALFKRLPATQRMLRAAIYFIQEATVFGTIIDRRLSKGLEIVGRRHLRSQVDDSELRRKLTPAYTIGCKRITLSDSYYPALTSPNVEVVTDRIESVTPNGIRTADGTERQLDTLIFGTGFNVLDHPGYELVRGREGRTLGEAWKGSPRAYLGATIAGFPNLFLLVGPNSAGGYNSIIFSAEAHVNYALAALREMDRSGAKIVDVRSEVYERWSKETERRLSNSVWNAGGCSSWYIDESGRNGVWWPGFTLRLWQKTRRFNAADYDVVTA
jgi:cation diffusion facilitator CzcD-associated flavoprotein CzcO